MDCETTLHSSNFLNGTGKLAFSDCVAVESKKGRSTTISGKWKSEPAAMSPGTAVLTVTCLNGLNYWSTDVLVTKSIRIVNLQRKKVWGCGGCCASSARRTAAESRYTDIAKTQMDTYCSGGWMTDRIISDCCFFFWKEKTIKRKHKKINEKPPDG